MAATMSTPYVTLFALVCLCLTGSTLARDLPALADAADDACSTCKWVAKIASDALCDDDAEAFVINTIQTSVCPALPVDLEQCKQLAEALVPVAIQWARSSATPESLCSAVGVCAPEQLQAKQPALAAARAGAAKLGAVKESVECSMCEYVVGKVKEEVDDPAALEAMKEKALAACSALPGDLATTCSDLVTNYASMLVLFIDSMDPKGSCTAVGLCTQQLTALTLPPLPLPLLTALGGVKSGMQAVAAASNRLGATNMCDMCRLAVLEIHTLVSSPAVQQQLTNYTESLCDSLGSAMAEACKEYVELYGPAVLQTLVTYLQPDPICQGLSMCDPSPAATAATAASGLARKDKAGVMQLLTGALRTNPLLLGSASAQKQRRQA